MSLETWPPIMYIRRWYKLHPETSQTCEVILHSSCWDATIVSTDRLCCPELGCSRIKCPSLRITSNLCWCIVKQETICLLFHGQFGVLILSHRFLLRHNTVQNYVWSQLLLLMKFHSSRPAVKGEEIYLCANSSAPSEWDGGLWKLQRSREQNSEKKRESEDRNRLRKQRGIER